MGGFRRRHGQRRAAATLTLTRSRTLPLPLTLALTLTLVEVGYERSAAGIDRMGAVLARLLGLNVRALRILGSTALGLAWVAAGP